MPNIIKNELNAEIIALIDWGEFFRFWKFKGKFPEILENDEAKKLFRDAQDLLKNLQKENFYCGEGKIEFFKAKSENDDIIILPNADSNFNETVTVRCLRQQSKKHDGEAYYCLADFICEDEKIGVFALTSGAGFDEKAREFEQNSDSYNSLLYQSLAQRLIEAFSRFYHEKYLDERNGIRPCIGYPSIPDLRIIKIIDRILDLKSIGISLSENFMMSPSASVCGFYITHPKVKYFSVRKPADDQILDYAERGGENFEDAKKWIA
jgi:5-methyltetrahydrofolate--homocysteine methyltransferase